MTANHNHNDDSWLDRNLQTIGRHLEIPEPGESLPTLPIGHDEEGVRRIMRNPFVRFIGAGSALAACLAISAIVFFPGGSKTVEAAMIFQSLRESMRKAFTMTIENVVDDGCRVDGEILVVLQDGSGLIPEENSLVAGDIRERGAFVEMRIRGEEGNPDTEGLNVEFALASTPEDEWAFVQVNSVPPDLATDEPLVAMLLGMARNGLFLNLDGVLQNKALLNTFNVVPPTTNADGAMKGPSFKLEVSSGANETTDAAVATSDEETVVISQWKFNLGATGAEEDSGAASIIPPSGLTRREQEEYVMRQAAAQLGMSYDDLVYVAEMLNAMFTGQMTPAQLDSLIGWIERSARDVSVVEREDGAFVLTARDFDLSSLPINAEAAAEIAHNAIEIGYRPETGVDWAAILHVGGKDGKMVFHFADRDTNDPVFDGSRYSTREGVRTIDLSWLAKTSGAANN